ncbi:MAG: NAD-dependent epimerase/dehydratase family protein [Planctomycetota bacterium]
MKILVTGGTGFIGSHIVDRLISEKHQVRCLIRNNKSQRWLAGKPVEFATGDILDSKTLFRAVRGVDTVIHAAGIVKAKDYSEFKKINIEGTLNTAKVCIAEKTKRFIFISSQAAAGPGKNETPLTEDSLCRPVSLYGKSKLEAERKLLSLRNKLDITIIRPCSVYGPRDSMILSLFQLIKKYRLNVTFGKKDTVASLIHVRDLADAVTLTLSPVAINKTYFVVSEKPYSMKTFLTLIEKITSVKTITLRVPYFFLCLTACLCEIFSTLTGSDALLSLGRLPEYRENYWVSSGQKIFRELGFKPKTELEEGIAETVNWYKKYEWL